MNEWKYDEATGAYYDPNDRPIKLSTTESAGGIGGGTQSTWLLLALGILALIAMRRK
jgi:hypothetical protein